MSDAVPPLWVRIEHVTRHANARTCTARPWPSCSRSDGQPIRHWVSSPWWVDTGAPLDPAR